MTNFLPHTPEEQKAMLNAIGVASVDALFDMVPKALRDVPEPKNMPLQGKTELEVQQLLTQYAGQNQGSQMESFLGGGAYHRFIPPAVNTVASRSEFYTAYTPYQPEISQGTLQMIYEFQTMMCELTGMDVTNASVYDGATAVSEAAAMAMRATRRKTFVVSNTVNPQYQQVLQTYAEGNGEVAIQGFYPGEPIASQVSDDPKTIAAVIVQQPDYFGSVRLLDDVRQFCDEAGALLIVSVDPVNLAVLRSPRDEGADIVCGDIQQLGNPVNYGGPYAGFISTTQGLIRQIPGRIVGRTKDKEGKTAYTLTLQTREQHIRRAKATSNICTNQSLNILKAAVYISLVGPHGLKRLSQVSIQRAHALADGLLEMSDVTLRFDADPFLNEFAVTLPIPAHEFVTRMAEEYGILAGIDVGQYWPEEEAHTLLVAVTEMNSPDSVDRYIQGAKSVLSGQKPSSVMKMERRRPSVSSVCAIGGAV